MSVVNPVKRALAQGVKYKGISRKQFRGDPGLIGTTHNPEPLSTCRKLKPEFEKNKQLRAQQKSPAEHSTPERRGPTKRAAGTSREQWCRIMSGK